MRRLIAPYIPEGAQGACIGMEFVIEFLHWANGHTPEAAAIMQRFDTSRATAYRYRRAYQTVLEKYGSLKFERTPRRS